MIMIRNKSNMEIVAQKAIQTGQNLYGRICNCIKYHQLTRQLLLSPVELYPQEAAEILGLIGAVMV